MAEQLEQVLADYREEAAVLRRAGNTGQADYVDRVLDAVAAAAEDYIRWLEESDAILKSGLAPRTLHRRFRELVDCGLARWTAGRRQYRSCAIPPRPNLAEARARGKDVAA
jgi:hypothetical protein